MAMLAANAAGSQMSTIFLIVLMIVFMYFFMIRPQQKQRKEHQSMVSQLKKGDHVVMISRLHGIIDEVNTAEQTVTIDCEGVYLTFDLNAIARVVPSKAVETKVSEEKAPAETTDKAEEKPAQNEAPKADDDAEK